MTEEVQEKIADVIPFPGVGTYFTKCCICHKEGEFEAYRIFEESLTKAYFYCNDCRQHHPQNFNIDISECPELSERVVLPKGVITWGPVK